MRLTYHELKEMVEDHRYGQWRAALSKVQGIHLNADSSNGQEDGAERILKAAIPTGRRVVTTEKLAALHDAIHTH